MSNLNIILSGEKFIANDVNNDGVLNLNDPQETFTNPEGRVLQRDDARIAQFQQLTHLSHTSFRIPLFQLQVAAASQVSRLNADSLLEAVANRSLRSASAQTRKNSDAVLGRPRTDAVRNEALEIVQNHIQALENIPAAQRAQTRDVLLSLHHLESSLNPTRLQLHSTSTGRNISSALGFAAVLGLSAALFFVPNLRRFAIPALILTGAIFAGCAGSNNSSTGLRANQEEIPAHSFGTVGVGCLEGEHIQDAPSCSATSTSTFEDIQSYPVFCNSLSENTENLEDSFSSYQLQSLRDYCSTLISSNHYVPSETVVCVSPNSTGDSANLRAVIQCGNQNW